MNVNIVTLDLFSVSVKKNDSHKVLTCSFIKKENIGFKVRREPILISLDQK